MIFGGGECELVWSMVHHQWEYVVLIEDELKVVALLDIWVNLVKCSPMSAATLQHGIHVRNAIYTILFLPISQVACIASDHGKGDEESH